MEQRQTAEAAPASRDVLISYAGHDVAWAEWIGAQVEQAGYSVFLLDWESRPGQNLILELDKALRTCERCLLVLSNDYLQDGLTQAQWAAVFRQDPTNEHRTLLPVKVEDCHPTGLLATHNPIDLSGLEEMEASERLLAFLAAEQFQPGQRISQQKPHQRFYPGSPVTWNLPYRRNPFFTAQEEHLSELRKRLWENQKAAVNQTEAISGLGGIGKTQLAVEYAYRHRADYTHVFWVRAETRGAIIDSYSEIADLLQLPERLEQDQSCMVTAVMRWLQKHRRYLLILDNADAPELLAKYLPSAPTGHLLLTTRSARLSEYGLGLSSQLAMAPLLPEFGGQLLLRRAGRLTQATEEEWKLASQLSVELGGLPLALDQAGAYLASTGKNLVAYSKLYRQRRLEVLKERYNLKEHPEPVVTTWDISFRVVEQQNPAASELLRFCAHLAPDAIPEMILTKGAEHLGPVLAPVAADAVTLDEAIRVLRGYSLVERDGEKEIVSVHRLVQAVVHAALAEEEQHAWAERAVLAIRRTFPCPQVDTWPICQGLLPHAHLCAEWIKNWGIRTVEAAELLHHASRYLHTRASYQEAQQYGEQAVVIKRAVLGEQHPDTAQSLNNLASTYRALGQFPKAIDALLQALEILVGKRHPGVVGSLSDLADVFADQGASLPEIEAVHLQILDMRRKMWGEQHRDIAESLTSLANVYADQGKFSEAEAAYQQALAICRAVLGEQHPDTARCLANLATVYLKHDKLSQAEMALQQALAILRSVLEEQHPDIAGGLVNLANVYLKQNKLSEAEAACQQALTIYRVVLSEQHPDTARCLVNLANIHRDQDKFPEAEAALRQALTIYSTEVGIQYPDTASSFTSLAKVYADQGKFSEAEAACQQALIIYRAVLGEQHPDTAGGLVNLANVYHEQGKFTEAEAIYQQALAIQRAVLGEQHLDTANSLNNLGLLYRTQHRLPESLECLQQAHAIFLMALGEQHPSTAQSLGNLATVYNAQGKFPQAEAAYQQALAIQRAVLGEQHRDTAASLNNLALVYAARGKFPETEAALQQALVIRRAVLGEQHPDTANSLYNLGLLYWNLPKALELLQQAHAIWHQTLGPEHPYTQRAKLAYEQVARERKR